MHCQGMKFSVPSVPKCHRVTHHLVHMVASGPAAFCSSRITILGARTSLKTAYGSICRAILHSHFFSPGLCYGSQVQFPFALGPTDLCSQYLPSLMTEEFLSSSREIRFPSFDFINLVILPTPKTSPHPLEAGRSMDHFSFVL